MVVIFTFGFLFHTDNEYIKPMNRHQTDEWKGKIFTDLNSSFYKHFVSNVNIFQPKVCINAQVFKFLIRAYLVLVVYIVGC